MVCVDLDRSTPMGTIEAVDAIGASVPVRSVVTEAIELKEYEMGSVSSPDPLLTFSACSLLNHRLLLGVVWWAATGSNRRPLACQASALPAELAARARGSGQLADSLF